MMITKQEVLEWLRAQPPDTKFDYGDTDDCLIARFLRARGEEDVTAGGYTATTSAGDYTTASELEGLRSGSYASVIEYLEGH